jgi:hypothetical protein
VLNTVKVLADEGGGGKPWVTPALLAKHGQSDDYCDPESEDDPEPQDEPGTEDDELEPEHDDAETEEGDIPPCPTTSRDPPRKSALPAHQPEHDDDPEPEDDPEPGDDSESDDQSEPEDQQSQDEDAEDDDSDPDNEPEPDHDDAETEEGDIPPHPAASRRLPRPPAKIRPAPPLAGAGRRPGVGGQLGVRRSVGSVCENSWWNMQSGSWTVKAA